jgi:hypothetical protein
MFCHPPTSQHLSTKGGPQVKRPGPKTTKGQGHQQNRDPSWHSTSFHIRDQKPPKILQKRNITQQKHSTKKPP